MLTLLGWVTLSWRHNLSLRAKYLSQVRYDESLIKAC